MQNMQKFTIFTIILTGLVVVTVSEIVVNEYLPRVDGDEIAQENLELNLPDSLDLSKTIETNVLASNDGGLNNHLGADTSQIPHTVETEETDSSPLNITDDLEKDIPPTTENEKTGPSLLDVMKEVEEDAVIRIGEKALAAEKAAKLAASMVQIPRPTPVVEAPTAIERLAVDPAYESLLRAEPETLYDVEISNPVATDTVELEMPVVRETEPIVASTVNAEDDIINGAVRVEEPEAKPSGLADFEDTSVEVVRYSPNVYLREEQLRSAGFVSAYLEEESNNGLLYKTIPIDDLSGVTINKYIIRTDNEMLAKVYVVKAGINMNINDVYGILKNRAASGLNTNINETNDFAINSFYMNDNSRPNTAFLTVRVGGLIYGFSYPKAYHSQIKNLIQLIEWELS